MNIARKIKDRRIELDLTMKQVADRVGVSEGTVSRWESGDISNMKRDKIYELSKVLHMSPLTILGYEEIPQEATPYNPTHRIPILGRISAGMPLYAEEQIEGYTYTELNGGAEYFALRVTGDSMTAARIYDGDTLIVRRQEYVENGQIAVVIVGDDEATVKRFYQTSSTITLMPQSTNPIHQPQIYDASKTNIRVVGLVVKNEITF